MTQKTLVSHQPDPEPSSWLRCYAGLIRPNGRVLDVAAGSGRNARWLASQGWQVEAVDKDAAALESMRGMANITTLVADLESAAWPYTTERFDAIVVCRYLYRPLLSMLAASLAKDGVLIYETFMQGHEAYGRPSNPDFLMRPNELLQAFKPELTLVAFEQGLISPPAMIQRICLVNGATNKLPMS